MLLPRALGGLLTGLDDNAHVYDEFALQVIDCAIPSLWLSGPRRGIRSVMVGSTLDAPAPSLTA